MLVVSDTTPLNILLTLSLEHILPALFQTVLIPQSVADELSQPSTLQAVREWVAHPPAWLTIQTPAVPLTSAGLRHRGERDAMQLALELKADAILLDEHTARMKATRLGSRVIGTVGLLEQAANKGIIRDLAHVHNQLRQSWFFVAEAILSDSLNRHRAWLENHPRT